MLDDDAAAALYDATAEEAANFGLLAYEVSNYARPGSESRHNLAYWRYGDYAGIGPGAHGRVSLDGNLLATRRHRAPEPWAELVERQGHGSTTEEIVAPRDRAREMLLMGLRAERRHRSCPLRHLAPASPWMTLWMPIRCNALWSRAIWSVTTSCAPPRKAANAWMRSWRS